MAEMSKSTQKIFDRLQQEMAAPLSPPASPVPSGPNQYAAVTRARDMGDVLLSEIVPDPNQVRQTFDEAELVSMTASIKAKGVLTALRVRWMPELGKWQTVLGGKRLECAKRAGLLKVPCKLVDGEMSRADCLEEQIAENEHRSAPPPLETAAAWKELKELRDWTQEQLAERLHLSQSRVSKTLKLLKLPESLQAEVKAGNIPPDVAVEMGKIKDPAEQEIIRGEYTAETMKRDDVRKTVKEKKGKGKKRKPAPKVSKTRRLPIEAGVTLIIESDEPYTDEDFYRFIRVLVERYMPPDQQRSAA